jgi:acyl-ACP thioesterase
LPRQLERNYFYLAKLNRANYRSWAQQLKWILDERALWQLVNGEETKPAVITTATVVETQQQTSSESAAIDTASHSLDQEVEEGSCNYRFVSNGRHYASLERC